MSFDYGGDGQFSCLRAKEPPGFQMECVTVCVNYADMLAHTLPHNRVLFDRMVVVTAPEDRETQRVCRYWDVKTVLTDEIRSRWPKEFHKGKGINEGLAALSKNGWLVHLDADVVLPVHFRKFMAGAELDTSMIYGCDRVEFKSYEDFQSFYGNPQLQIDGDYNCFVNVSHCEGQRIGTRVAFFHQGGYLPIGFVQVWHADSGFLKYQDGHTDASREDNLFALQWPRAKRGFLPEVLAYHLESEEAPMAVNWKGRQTKRFGINQ